MRVPYARSPRAKFSKRGGVERKDWGTRNAVIALVAWWHECARGVFSPGIRARPSGWLYTIHDRRSPVEGVEKEGRERHRGKKPRNQRDSYGAGRRDDQKSTLVTDTNKERPVFRPFQERKEEGGEVHGPMELILYVCGWTDLI